MNTFTVQNWGLISYDEALNKQQEIFDMLLHNKINHIHNINNYLVFCEHNNVFTLGRNGRKENLLINEQELIQNDISFSNTTRGGDITYHGPGQVVCYPIIDLDNFFKDIHKYMRMLEEIVIQTLLHYNIQATRLEKLTGVWINKNNTYKKICAMGIKCSRWITMHGLALNVNTDLSYFDKIIPCGIQDKGITSIKEELNTNINQQEVINLIVKNFANIFEAKIKL